MMEEYNELFRYEQSQARDLEEREKLILKHHRSLNCVLTENQPEGIIDS